MAHPSYTEMENTAQGCKSSSVEFSSSVNLHMVRSPHPLDVGPTMSLRVLYSAPLKKLRIVGIMYEDSGVDGNLPLPCSLLVLPRMLKAPIPSTLSPLEMADSPA